MKTRNKTAEEQRHDVFETTRALENLHIEAEKFMDEFIDMDGNVLYQTVTTLRDAIWRARFQKSNLAARKVGDKYNEEESSHYCRYEDMGED